MKELKMTAGSKELKDYLVKEIKVYKDDDYEMFVDVEDDVKKKYWDYVDEEIKKYIDKEEINVLELYEGLSILYFGYIDIIENGGDDCGIIWNDWYEWWLMIENDLGFKRNEYNNSLLYLIRKELNIDNEDDIDEE